MKEIYFNDVNEGYGEDWWTDNQKYYGQFFFAIFLELYHILFEGSDTTKLDEILINLQSIFKKLNRQQTIWLENSPSYCFNTSFDTEKCVIDSAYLKEYQNRINKKDITFLIYIEHEFLSDIILGRIYSDVKLLKKNPTFLQGEFAKFLKMQDVKTHNNIGYLEMVSVIYSKLEKYPELLKSAKENIIDLNKLDEMEGFHRLRGVCDFSYWFSYDEYFRKIYERQLPLNEAFDFMVARKPKIEIPENIFSFLFSTFFNYSITAPVDYEKCVSKVQEQILDDYDSSFVEEIVVFLKENETYFRNLQYFDEEIALLNEIQSKKRDKYEKTLKNEKVFNNL